MSSMTSRIKNKKTPKRPEEPKKPKVGKDYLLLALIGVTIIILLTTFNVMEPIGIAMYIALLIGMVCVYIPRHYPIPSNREKLMSYVTVAALAISVVLMIANFVTQYNK